MKKALLIVCAVVCSVFYVAAQQLEEVVYLKDGSVVRGVILEQVPGKTLKIQIIGGNQFVYKIEDVIKITKEPVQYYQYYQQPQYQQRQQAQPQYQQAQPQSSRMPNPMTIATTPKVKQPIDWSVRYKGEVNLGFAITGKKTEWEYEMNVEYNGKSDSESGDAGKRQTVFSRPLFETIHGVEIGPYFFVGAGIGLQYYCGKLKDFQMGDEQAASIGISKPAKRWNAVMLPIFADIKFMYPVNDDFIPYIDLGLGGTVACTSALNFSYSKYGGESSQKLRGGFYCNFGVGFHYKKLNVSLGLQHQGLKIASHYKYEEYGYGGDYTVTEDTTSSTKVNAFYIKVGVNF